MIQTQTKSEIKDLIAELEWRGLIKDCTDKEALRDHLRSPGRKIYAGFDPTADSLTIGNLVPIMMLAHVKRAGHVPVVVMGGGTGLIGDPSGKSAERQLNTPETINTFIDGQRPIYAAVLGEEGKDFELKNNLDWLGGISYIEALRDIGKHYSVNMMMQKESVRERLNNREQGISYTEFSYMILQAYDFAYLYKKNGVTVQFGGSDQYGNIVAGSDLVKRTATSIALDRIDRLYEQVDELFDDAEASLWKKNIHLNTGLSLSGVNQSPRADKDELRQLLVNWSSFTIEFKESLLDTTYALQKFIDANHTFGLTAPLVSKADGGKFGKTETGAIWLTAARTSPYAYYQFWLNASDEDARNWIKVFTFLDEPTIEALIARHDENPGMRELQRTLAREATKILHGEEVMLNAEAAGKALFSGDIGSLDQQTMLEVFASVPTTEHAKSELDGDGVDPVELLKTCDLASSNREAREFLGNGSVSINGQKIDGDTRINASHLLHGSFIAIRRGKKKWHLTKWE